MERDSAGAATRGAKLLAFAGVMALFAAAADPTIDRGAMLALGIADLVVAALIGVLPWGAWPRRATLGIAVAAFALSGMAGGAGLVPLRAHALTFVLVFVWVGLHHRPWESVLVLPAAALGYAVPLLLVDADPPFNGRSLGLVLLVGFAVAETIARGTAATAEARERAELAARKLRVVTDMSAHLRRIDPTAVLDAVVDAAMAFGYDGANLAILEPDGATFTPRHARGLAVAYADRPYDPRAGITGQVIEAGAPVVVDDYLVAERSIPEIRAAGVRTCVAVPVVREGVLVAVLFVASATVVSVRPEDVDALRLLGDTAGAALADVEALRTQRDAATMHELDALTDGLTGVGNRRLADQLLGRLSPGDAVVMIDLDGFKAVNDRFGHAAGDQVLVELAAHLSVSVRRDDVVARFGGEEFVVLLPRTTGPAAQASVDRLLQAWRARQPLTTFSAGVAVCEPGETAADVLARADAALYEAKRRGRSRVQPA